MMERDIAQGMLIHVEPDPSAVPRIAIRLTDEFAPTIGCRTLDVLHVATAKALDCARIFTHDTRQASLARAAGLEVLGPVRRPR